VIIRAFILDTIVDFNGGGKVDIADLKAFTAEWEKQSPPVKP